MGNNGGFYFQLHNAVVDDWVCVLGAGAFTVYCLITRRYNNTTKTTVYESHRAIAQRLGLHKNSAERHLKRLLKHGLIQRIPTGKKNKHLRFVYVPVLPPPVVPNSTIKVLSIDTTDSTSGIAEDSKTQQVNTLKRHTKEKGKKEASKTDPNGSSFNALVEDQRKRDRKAGYEETITPESENAAKADAQT